MKRILSFILICTMSLTMVCSFPSQHTVYAATGESYSVKISGTVNYASGQEMISYINEERAAQGAGALELDSQLTDAAMQRAAEIAYYFSHTRPDGTMCYTACSRAYGENIAAGRSTASGTFTQWMNSDGHRANMMNTGYTKIGIGHFQHNGMHYWVQLFGRDSANYSETRTSTASMSATVNIVEGTSPVELNKGEVSTTEGLSLTVGDTYTLSPGAVNAGWTYAYCKFDGDSFNWSSSDTSVATISADGKITAVGLGDVVIKGSAKSGSISDLYFNLNVGKDIGETTISDIASVAYTGAAHTPSVKVYDGDVLLQENKDYKLSYRNNLSAGTAYIDITGMGDYGGTVTKSFVITPINLDGVAEITLPNWDDAAYSSTYDFLKANVSVKLNGTALSINTDYYISGISSSGDEPVYFVIRYIGNYTGSTVIYNLERKTVQDIAAQTYTGKAIEPAVTISGLTEGKDYKVTYSNHVNAGTATATIEGIGAYRGTLTKTFTINPANIGKETITLSPSIFTYDGTAKKPKVIISGLSEGTDYTVTYGENINAGTGSVTVKGKGNYTGSASVAFTINPKTMTGIVAYSILTAYNGKPQSIDITGVPEGAKVTYSTSENGTYTETAPTRTDAGTTKVYYRITKENYKTVSGYANITINPVSLPDTAVLEYTESVYDGKAHTPSVSIKGLTEGKDFTVAYSNHINAGTATVTITGKGNYQNTTTKNFTISPAALPDAVLEYEATGYDGTAKKPKVTIAGLTEGKDFDVAYGNNVNKGTAVVTITGKGNYTGTQTRKFEIRKDIAATSVSGVEDTVYNGNARQCSLLVYDGSQLLQEGKDYTLTYANNVNAGTASVTIEGMGEYAGTVTKNFEIAPASAADFDADLSYTKVVYNGKIRKPSVSVRDADGNKLTVDDDFDVDYGDGRKLPGRYAVTITFKGNYTGTKTLYFTIVPKAPSSASAKLTGYDDVKFSWKKSTGASGYTVYYKKSTSSKWISLGRTTKTYKTKYNLSDGVKYDFKVVPYYKDADGTRYADTAQYKKASATTLKKVTVSKLSRSSGKVKVTWKDISGESGYQISKSTKKSGTYTVYKSLKANTKSKLVSATKGKTYWYKVRAYKTVDGKMIYGPWSTPKKYSR